MNKYGYGDVATSWWTIECSRAVTWGYCGDGIPNWLEECDGWVWCDATCRREAPDCDLVDVDGRHQAHIVDKHLPGHLVRHRQERDFSGNNICSTDCSVRDKYRYGDGRDEWMNSRMFSDGDVRVLWRRDKELIRGMWWTCMMLWVVKWVGMSMDRSSMYLERNTWINYHLFMRKYSRPLTFSWLEHLKMILLQQLIDEMGRL